MATSNTATTGTTATTATSNGSATTNGLSNSGQRTAAARREHRFSDRAITTVGLLLSIVVGALLPLLAGDVDVTLQVVLGLVSFTVGYLLTMDLAFRVRIHEMEDRILQRIDEAEDLRIGALPLQRLLSVPNIESAVIEIVEAAADTQAKRMPFLAKRTIERIQLGRDETLRIANGVFHCADHRDELRLVNHALDDTKATLKAVAGLGLDHWRTWEYQEYFDVYLEHSTRLQQTRVFLVDDADMADPAMMRLLERHASKGVTTYAVHRDRVPHALKAPMVLFDDALLLLHTRKTPGEVGAEVAFTDDPARAQAAAQDFNSLMKFIERSDSSVVVWTSTGVHTPV